MSTRRQDERMELARRTPRRRERAWLRPQVDLLEGRVMPSFTTASFPAPGFVEPTTPSGGPAAPSAAASPTRVLSAVNGQIEITDQQGNLQQAMSLSSFFTGDTHGAALFDPSVVYDPYAQRFWVIVGEGGPTSPSSSYFDIAVSTASGPTLNASDWHFYSITASDSHTGTTYGADYPRAAVDATNLYISVNYLSNAPSPVFEYAGVFRLNKSLMIDNQPLTGNLAAVLPGNGAQSLEPAQSYNGLPTDPQYFVDSSTAAGGSIRVWSWAPTGTAPTLQATIAAPFTALSPPGVPQAGSSVDVDTMDSRLTSAVYRNGFIATAQTVKDNGLAAVQWYELNVPAPSAITSPNAKYEYGVVQSGNIAVSGSNTFDPEVAVDAQGDLGITYTQSDGTIDPRAMFTARGANDPPNQLQTPVVVATSASYFNEYTYTSGTQTIGKWGPWQGLAVDPSAPTFWALGEYANTAHQWSAGWGEFQFSPISQGLMLDNTSPHTAFSPPLNAALTAGPSSVVVTFNHQLQGFVPGALTAGMASNIYAIAVVPWGPDGVADAGDISLNGTLNYSINSDGTSAITFTPNLPWSTDVYSIDVSGSLTDVSGNVLKDSNGNPGPEYSSFLVRYGQITTAAPAVTKVTVNNGATTVNNNVIPWFDAIAITFNKALNIQHANSGSYLQLWQKPNANGTYTQVPNVTVAYNPGTLTAYLIPTVSLQATYGAGAIYLIVVNSTLDDNTQYPSAGTTMGTTYYNTFSLQSQSSPANISPLTILQQNGNDVSTPGNGTQTFSTIGYGTVTMTEAVSPSSLGKYSFTLIPESGGFTSQGDAADLPVNAVVAFNPNTNQLVIVPTVPLGSNVYLYTLSTPMSAANNSDSLNGSPLYETFQLTVNQAVSFVQVRPHTAVSASPVGGPAPGTGAAAEPLSFWGVLANPTASKGSRSAGSRERPVRLPAGATQRHDIALGRVAAPLPTLSRTRRLGAWSAQN